MTNTFDGMDTHPDKQYVSLEDYDTLAELYNELLRASRVAGYFTETSPEEEARLRYKKALEDIQKEPVGHWDDFEYYCDWVVKCVKEALND